MTFIKLQEYLSRIPNTLKRMDMPRLRKGLVKSMTYLEEDGDAEVEEGLCEVDDLP